MSTFEQQIYHQYLDFLAAWERRRQWSLFDDIPWDKLNAHKAGEDVKQRVEIFCAEEMYVPDYSAAGLELCRSTFGQAWFQALWALEESKHGLVFREYLNRSGMWPEAQFGAFEAKVFAQKWKLPFAKPRQMACYGALQEGVTYCAYHAQRECARQAGDEVLEAIFFYVGRDEAAHAGFYRAMVELELSYDRPGTIADMAEVLDRFKMPGDGIIEDYHQRLKNSGAEISPRAFLQQVVKPLLVKLGITVQDLRAARQEQRPEVPAA